MKMRMSGGARGRMTGLRPVALVAAVLAVAGLGLDRRESAGGDPREIEILSRIVELRGVAVEHMRSRNEAGLVGPREYAEVQGAWCEARACLAREREDEAAEREALGQHLGLLKELADRMARAPESYGADERVEAEIAALRCELRIERVGEE